MHYAFIIDNRKCIGCHACTVACKSEHDVPIGVNRTWVKYIEKGSFPDTRRHFSVMRCNHCEDAPCIEICPVTALFKRDDGIVDFDNLRCIGCKACTQACPYDALYIDPETHTAAKCNYCAHRIDRGLEPACVNVCPTKAIISGDMDNPQSEIAVMLSREKVTVRKPEKGTKPKLFYIDGDTTSLEPTATDQTDSYMWSSQIAGVGHFARYAENRIADSDQDVLKQKLTNSSGDAVAEEESRDNAKRVYDAPSKGSLWGWEVSAYLWTKSIASGVFLVPILLTLFNIQVNQAVLRSCALLSLLFLGLTGGLLIKDLDKPSRFFYVVLRPQWKSWLVRGAYIIAGYGFILTLWFVSGMTGLRQLQLLTQWAVIPFAILMAVYTAFLFSQASARDFWQSPVLPVHMLVHAVLAGSAVFAIAASFHFAADSIFEIIRWIMTGGVMVNLASQVLELTVPHSTETAKQTVDSIVKGPFKNLFRFGLVFTGNIVPLAFLHFGGQVNVLIAGGFILIGIYIAEHILVKAPQKIPLS